LSANFPCPGEKGTQQENSGECGKVRKQELAGGTDDDDAMKNMGEQCRLGNDTDPGCRGYDSGEQNRSATLCAQSMEPNKGG